MVLEMRVDIKKVKGKSYLQYIDSFRHLHHLGSAKDFGSWLLALYLWDEEWNLKRESFFESMKVRIQEHLVLNEKMIKLMWEYFALYPWKEKMPTSMTKRLDKIYQKKEICENIRKWVQDQFPWVKNKTMLRNVTNISRRTDKTT